MKSTKIVCTIGPASHSKKIIEEMARAGMNLVRMNFSHGSYSFHRKTIQASRDVSKKLERHIGILLDLQGPKIRTGKLAKETVELKQGDEVTLTIRDVEGDWNIMSVNYDRLPSEVKKSERILLDDGNIELRVIGLEQDSVRCKIINGGVIRSYRGVNLPESIISVQSVTKKDVADLDFGIENGVDFVALSFVRKPEDIQYLRMLMQERGTVLPIIAKIEKPEAIQNINGIIDEADGVMVARGDLGAETSPQDVPVLQKMIIRKCNQAGKPVITATQMLESMIVHPRPTRAEAADVANAIFDGSDAVMLSGETAMGEYPVRAVKTMAEIAQRAEEEINRREADGFSPRRKEIPESDNIADCMSYSATRLTELIYPRYIISFTLSGKTAALVSKYRPPVPVIAMSPNEEVLRRLSIYSSVYGVYIDHVSSTEQLLDRAEKIVVHKGFCREGDTVLFIGGVPVLAGEPTNMLKVHRVMLGQKNI